MSQWQCILTAGDGAQLALRDGDTDRAPKRVLHRVVQTGAPFGSANRAMPVRVYELADWGTTSGGEHVAWYREVV